MELTEINWYISCKKKKNYMCKKCMSIISKKTYLITRDKIINKNKEYADKNIDSIQVYKKKWYLKNKLMILNKRKINYELNKHEILLEAKERYKNNLEIIKTRQEKYRRTHRNEIKELNKNYRQTLRGKKSRRLSRYKRKKLGNYNLNEPFENSVAHHVDLETIIFVPEWINKICYHNVRSGLNMNIVNSFSYFFLLMQNIKSLNIYW